MTKQSSDKVRRYQSARTRLPGIMLTTVDRANLDACIMRHGTTAEAVKESVRHLDWLLYRLEELPVVDFSSPTTGKQLQSIFVSGDVAAMFERCVGCYGNGPKALRQALHEYATHITKTIKQLDRRR